MKQLSFLSKNCCALITGASSGLGVEFARQLAPHASVVILVARRHEKLEQLARELKELAPSLVVYQQVIDLRDHSEREKLAAWIKEKQLPLNLLINNAGLGDLGDFYHSSWKRLQDILTVNIEALTHLTYLFLPLLRAHSTSAILNVGSVAGFFPLPNNAVYAASKAYVKHFSEALRVEEKSHGVHVTLLCPGPAPTEFFEVAGRLGEKIEPTSRVPSLLVTSAHDVVAVGLRALSFSEISIIPNRFLRGIMALFSILPSFIVRKILSYER